MTQTMSRVGPELLGDEAWRPELPQLSCPNHGWGAVAWHRHHRSGELRLSCAASEQARRFGFGGLICDMGPHEAGGTAFALVIHTNGLVYAVRAPATV